jgi:hypothetical protein
MGSDVCGLYRLHNPNTRPPSTCMDSSTTSAAVCVTYRQATATRIPACASFNDPRAVSNRARAQPPVQPKPSAKFRATELMARRSCEARSRSLRWMASTSGRACSTTASACSTIVELFGLWMPIHGAVCVPTDSLKLRNYGRSLARRVRHRQAQSEKRRLGPTATATATATTVAGCGCSSSRQVRPPSAGPVAVTVAEAVTPPVPLESSSRNAVFGVGAPKTHIATYADARTSADCADCADARTSADCADCTDDTSVQMRQPIATGDLRKRPIPAPGTWHDGLLLRG